MALTGVLVTPRTLPNTSRPSGVPGSRVVFFLVIGRAVRQASETDTAQQVTPGGAPSQTRTVNQAAGIERAQPITAITGAPPAVSGPQRVALAHYTLEVAWSAQAQGAFVFGTSTLGGSDTLAVSVFDVTFSGEHDDLSPLFRGARVRRGRDDSRTFVVRGEMQATLRDREGLLNPENVTSPLHGLLTDHHQHGRLRGFLPSGTSFPLFYGFLERIEWKPLRRYPGAGDVVLTFRDLLLWLGEARPIIPSTGPTTTGEAIGVVLDAVGWIDPSGRSLATGDAIPDFAADGSQTALELISELLTAERGIFYIDGAGVATYESRIERSIKVPAAAIVDEMKAASPGTDQSRRRSRVRVKRTQNEYVATAQDVALRTLIGDRDLEDIETPYLSSDGQADALASFILNQLGAPLPPLRDLVIDNRREALLFQCFARELGDVVTVSAAGAQIVNPAYLIESLEHRIEPRRARHETSWLLSQHSVVAAFRIGQSTLVSEGDEGHAFVF